MRFELFSEPNISEITEELIKECMSDNIARVEELIIRGADINGVNSEYGDTALSQAALHNQKDIVTLLLTYPVSQYSKNIALIFAAQAGHVEIMNILLKSGADVNSDAHASFGYYNPPLHQTIAQNKFAAFKRLLEVANIDVNLEDESHRIPLLLAAYNGRFDMVRCLVEAGADLDIKNSQGQTAEWLAKQRNHEQIVTYLQRAKLEKSDMEYKH